jgi:UDP-3-O-[3-hydroxymyristoyl] glucosamine N-acyltransferase
MTTQEIAELVSGELIGDGSVEILNVAALDSASTGDLAFSESGNQPSKASCVLVPPDFEGDLTGPYIKVKNPKLAFTRIAQMMAPSEDRPRGLHSMSVIDPTAEVSAAFVGAFTSVGAASRISAGCHIYEGVRIGRNVQIGENTIIFPNCVIYDNVKIGGDCVLHGGVVIGAPGFGYVKDEASEYHQFPQIGTVVIDDRVEIGANACVDRGALGETRIGEGTKIDNLVQIGHNVQIGKRVVIAAQTGISGSTVIEDDCVIGGQVGMGDHARVLSGAIIGSQAGVLPGKIVRPGVWWGTPVQPLETYKRQNALVKSLPRIKDDLRKLRDDISRLRTSDEENQKH